MNIHYDRLLEGKRAVVTDGDSAIGRAIVRLFAWHGAQIAFGARDVPRARALAREIGVVSPQSFAHPMDLADAPSVEAFCAEVNARWPLTHVLINNPVCGGEQAIDRTRDEDDDAILQIVQHATVQTLRAFWPAMIRSGGCSVVNISSALVFRPVPGRLMAAMAYGSLGGMTRVPAVEGGIHEVRVNEIYAGYGANGGERARAPLAVDDEEGRADVMGVAKAALFLASDMASYISGASLSVSGGAQRLRAAKASC